MTYNINELDKDVARMIRFVQRENNCAVVLASDNNKYSMLVCELSTGNTKIIELSNINENKYKLIKAIRDYFKAH